MEPPSLTYCTFFVLAVSLQNPVARKLGEFYEPLRHWKIWLHASNGENAYLHLHKIGAGEEIKADCDNDLLPGEREFIEKHGSLLFVGLTLQTVAEVVEIGSFNFASSLGFSLKQRNE
jgi:hypothetical protein